MRVRTHIILIYLLMFSMMVVFLQHQKHLEVAMEQHRGIAEKMTNSDVVQSAEISRLREHQNELEKVTQDLLQHESSDFATHERVFDNLRNMDRRIAVLNNRADTLAQAYIAVTGAYK